MVLCISILDVYIGEDTKIVIGAFSWLKSQKHVELLQYFYLIPSVLILSSISSAYRDYNKKNAIEPWFCFQTRGLRSWKYLNKRLRVAAVLFWHNNRSQYQHYWSLVLKGRIRNSDEANLRISKVLQNIFLFWKDINFYFKISSGIKNVLIFITDGGDIITSISS